MDSVDLAHGQHTRGDKCVCLHRVYVLDNDDVWLVKCRANGEYADGRIIKTRVCRPFLIQLMTE